jgi:ribosomal protein L12E/L44/L45/RPP1/RPP2
MSLGPLASLDKSVKDELACTLALLILYDDKAPVSSSKLSEITRAAGVSVEAYVPKQFENALATTSLDSVISVSGGGSGGAPAPAAAATQAPAEPQKKEDKKPGEAL